jgi:transcriptional regulator of arginine metabolism
MSKEKTHRLHLIRAILEKGDMHSQTELKKRLEKKGIDVSTSTISRYLKELGYTRAPIGDGSYRLVNTEGRNEHLELLFKLGLVELTPVGNIIVIKTRPGNAQAVAGAIDRSRIEGIIGTVGGDDTIFGITKNESVARTVVKNLKRYMA